MEYPEYNGRNELPFLTFNKIIINSWHLYSAISIHKMFKSAAHCHCLSNTCSPQSLSGRAEKGVLRHFFKAWHDVASFRCCGSAFHKRGAQLQKAQSTYLSLVRGSSRRPFTSDRRWRLGIYGTSRSLMFLGASPLSALYTSIRTLNWMRNFTYMFIKTSI